MQDLYPDNTLATFTVKLPTELDFSVGKWECALTEIQFFKSWFNVMDATLTLTISKDTFTEDTFTLQVPNSYYSSPTELIEVINQKIKDEWSYYQKYKCSLKYNEHTKKVRAQMVVEPDYPGLTWEYNKALKTVMGFNELTPQSGTSEYNVILEGTKPCNLVHLYDIMVYSDIIQGSIVGDTEAPLLRAVSVDPGHWSKQCTIYQRPQYFPLSKSKFQSISILLRTDTGSPVPFTNGRTIATLDFRRIKPYYL